MKTLCNLLPVGALTLALLSGCGHEPSAKPTADGGHGHAHDHPTPTNFAEALANVKTINHEVSEAFVAGNTKQADVAIHEAFGAITALEKLAKQDGFDEDTTKEVVEASETLLGAYDYLHGIHIGKEVDYGQVGKEIEAAIARLAELTHDHEEASE